jgi:hypothetical protein
MLRKKNRKKNNVSLSYAQDRNYKEAVMKKQNVVIKIIKKIFLKETTIRADGKEVKGFTIFGWVLIIAAAVIGLVVLEQFGVIDDFVRMKTHHNDRR